MKVENGRVTIDVTRPLDRFEVVGLSAAITRAQIELWPKLKP